MTPVTLRESRALLGQSWDPSSTLISFMAGSTIPRFPHAAIIVLTSPSAESVSSTLSSNANILLQEGRNDMAPGRCTLVWNGPSPLFITFHQTTRVCDHEHSSKQTVAAAKDVYPANPCELIRWPPDGDEWSYLLAVDCPAGKGKVPSSTFQSRVVACRPLYTASAKLSPEHLK